MKKIIIAATTLLVFNLMAEGQQLKGDPWIFQVYKEVYKREPSAWELNIKLYNNGSWGSYTELKKEIIQYQTSLSLQGIKIECTKIANSNNFIALFNQDGKSIAANLVGNDGGSIIAAGGGNIVAAGGGNIVAAGGGNIVAAGGGNIVALPGAYLGSSYSLMSGAKKVLKVNNASIVIK